MLRSYDSRREPAPEFDCKIWEAGRATCAIGLAFKPIQIGQSVFHDDGAGNFNPAMYALDEAVVNEWPGREVGVFISVGTGKRPKDSDANASVWYEGFLGEYAEARRKLIAKIEGCEKIHEGMQKEHLAKRGVNIENYYRFNVEVGVGDFAMNEWSRLADISTNTRRYLAREEEQKMVQNSATKLGKIHLAKLRWDRMGSAASAAQAQAQAQSYPEIQMPLAVELPGDIPTFVPGTPPNRQSYDSGLDTLVVPGANSPSPRSSGERLQPIPQANSRPSSHRPPAAPTSAPPPPPPGRFKSSDHEDADRLMVNAPTPSQWRHASGADKIAIVSADDHPRRYVDPIAAGPNQLPPQPPRIEPPPLPPKTPLPGNLGPYGGFGGDVRRPAAPALPYPLDEDAPPAVNMARKPHYSGR